MTTPSTAMQVPLLDLLPEAERAARETLALPIYPELRLEQQQQYVVDALRRFQP